MSISQFNESETRYNLIDPQVAKAGWIIEDRRQVGLEVPVDLYDKTPVDGFTDYCLYRQNGEALTAVEAKCTRIYSSTFDDGEGRLQIKGGRLCVGPLQTLEESFITSKTEHQLLLLAKQEEGEHENPESIGNLEGEIESDVERLQTNINVVAPHIALRSEGLEGALCPTEPDSASRKRIRSMAKRLAPLMKYRRPKDFAILELDRDDVIETRRWVVLSPKDGDSEAPARMMVEEYREKVEKRKLELAQNHPTPQKLKTGETLNTHDLVELELTLETEMEKEGLPLPPENIEKAFQVRAGNFNDCLRHALGLQQLLTREGLVKQAFDAFDLEYDYNTDQTRCLRTVQHVFLQRGKVELNDLYEHPFSQFGVNAVERLFGLNDLKYLKKLY